MNKKYYQVVFEPVKYGIISYKVYSRDVAYAEYRKLKESMKNRPGKLYVKEFTLIDNNNYKENYLCSIRTGKDFDGLKIIQNMQEELKVLINTVYNQYNLEKKIKQMGDLELDIVHGLEIIDESKMPEGFREMVVNNFQVVSSARRGYKHAMKEAQDVATKLRELSGLLQSMNSKVSNDRVDKETNDKRVANDKEARNRYLTALGINIEAYDNDDTDNILNPQMITSLIKKINDEGTKKN